jgi:hypothetical protein
VPNVAKIGVGARLSAQKPMMEVRALLGETNLDNLILLCRRHHTLVHNSRWDIEQTADGDFAFIHPARGP